ncbi:MULTISPECIES: SLC5/6 family protein [Legionella]|uniref:HAAAP family serine/threonine permease n=1 Tax=Legionella TaxID=445 RepID=UPI000F8CFCDE|nr:MULTISPECIES: HAAAP family serine/threonine permease [Legionella]MCP0914111.1 HAAAP family serine/threonine permease [Legionella sp. 27cVA30]RUQ99962.1 HAAAP family serine/threonine permease [Legionella septentrionalis]RUR10193.1 HAAAP family serine/threonine permease [Legionella septentrionalis]
MPPDVALAKETPIVKERKQDTVWMLSLYGTAIGAGTLFLPIDAGLHGIWPLIIMALLAFPMTYFSHQALCRFVLSGSAAKNDITDVVDEHFGPFAGKILTLFYFFAIFPILLMYSVAITNTTNSFIVNQLGVSAPPRALLALLLILGLMGIVRLGQQVIIRSMSYLVYPFLSILILLSLYLVPHWNGAIFHHANTTHHPHGFLMTLWLVIPVMVFSFNHSPIISSFAVSQKQLFGAKADKNSSRILRNSHILMVTTVMFFVFSCVFSLSSQDLALAKQQNISILSYLANHFHTPFIAYVAPVIAFIAIAKSFLGHYLGASEGLHGLLGKTLQSRGKMIGKTPLQYLIEGFIILSCWLAATFNPNILTMIETLGGPIIAIILFLMPMYAIAAVPAMKIYRRPLQNGFVTFIGLIAISAILYGLWKTICG